MKYTYSFYWAWDDQPDWEKIFKAIHELTDQGLYAYHYEINTSNGEKALLISANSGLTDKQAYNAWKVLEHGI